MRQTYEIWDIIPGRKIEASIDGLIDDWEGFRVIIRDNKTNDVIRISFAEHVAYQSRDESDLDGEAARSDGLQNGCFYIVKNSEFINRFVADSVRQFKTIIHYSIVTQVDCIDVLTTDVPIVELL